MSAQSTAVKATTEDKSAATVESDSTPATASSIPPSSAGAPASSASKSKKKKKKNKKSSVSVPSSAAQTPLDSPVNVVKEPTHVTEDDADGKQALVITPAEEKQTPAISTQETSAGLPESVEPPTREVKEPPNTGDNSMESRQSKMEEPPLQPAARKDEDPASTSQSIVLEDNPGLPTREEELDAVAAATARTAVPMSALPPARDATELPNFGDYVAHDQAAKPEMGVPAPMPHRGSNLFADEGEQDAFLDSTDPRDAFFVPVEPEVVVQAEAGARAEDRTTAAATSHVQASSHVPTFVDDDFEEAAFDDEGDVDQAVTEAGDEHASKKDKKVSSNASASEPSSTSPEAIRSSADGRPSPAAIASRTAATPASEPPVVAPVKTGAPSPVTGPSLAEKTTATLAEETKSSEKLPELEVAPSATGALDTSEETAPARTQIPPTSSKPSEVEPAELGLSTTSATTHEDNSDLAERSATVALSPKPSTAAGSSLFADDTPEFDIGDQQIDGDERGQDSAQEVETKVDTEPKGENVGAAEKPAHTVALAHDLFGDDTSDFAIGGTEEAASPSTTNARLDSSAATAASTLFGDDDDQLDFGESPYPRPELPGEISTDRNAQTADSTRAGTRSDRQNANDSLQSMFGGPDTTADWLVDTSVDDSLNLGRDDIADEDTHLEKEDFDDMDSQVPQGWYDEAGEWNWYTDEEREQVRISMFGEKSTSQVAGTGTTPASSSANDTTASDPYAPTVYAPTTSDSYSPRTSLSGYAPAMTPSNAYAPAASPYAPSTAVTNPYAPQVPSPATSYFPQQPAASGLFTPGIPQSSVSASAPYGATAPYAPAPAVATPYGAQPSPYDPYASAPQLANAYAPSSSAPPGPAAPIAPPKQPGPLKRMKSTAYDPPFIKPPKTASRPAVATPVAALPAAPMAAPPAVVPTPPPGPPRRSATTERVPSVNAEPPRRQSTTVPQPASSFQSATSPLSPGFDIDNSRSEAPQVVKAATDEYAPSPAVDPYAPAPASPMNPYILAPMHKPEAPVQPPKRPTTASSTHPPKPTSFDPPLRPSSSRPPSRHAQKPNFAAPPAPNAYGQTDTASAIPPVPPIPSGFAAPPPKGASRHASPAPSFAPPPSAAEPPRRGPSRGPPGTTPMFEAPPVIAAPPPPRIQSPPATSHAPPLRGASPLGAPPRVASPLRNEIKPKVREAISLHDEFDPEGGMGEVWDEDSTDISLMPPQHSTPPAPPRTQDWEEEDTQETPKSEEPSPITTSKRLQEAVDESQPSTEDDSPYKASDSRKGSASHDSYAHGSHTQDASHSTFPSDGPAPKQSDAVRHHPQSDYNPYASTSPKQDSRQPISDTYNPYAAPSSPQKSTRTELADPYNPYAAGASYAPSTSPKQSLRKDSAEQYNPYAAAPRSSTEFARPAGQGYSQQPPAAHSRQTSVTDVYNPYAPGQSATQTYNPYAPGSSPVDRTSPVQTKADEYNPYAARTSPVKSFTSPPNAQGPLPPRATTYDPYAPTSVNKQKSSDLYSPGMDAYGTRTASPPQANYFQSMGAVGPADSTYVPQQVLEQRPVSEDPLGRCDPSARNNPIAIFGFGGVLITSLPGTAEDSPDAPSYGYASHRGLITIRPIAEVVESSALGTSSVAFPGPLVHDPSVAKGAAGEKKRREGVLAYLSARADEIERGLPYLKSSASSARREEEAKLVIVRILTALIEGDGKLFGTTKAEEALRAALQPPASSTATMSNGLGSQPKTKSATATASQLTQLSSMLLGGDKKDAAHFAAEAGLWSHALVISSAVGPDLWREIVTRFTAAELGQNPESAGLRAAYSVFSGLQPSTVDDLFTAANITNDPSADHWREVVAAVIFNGKPTDLICLDDLGGRLARAGLRTAAQACYILSPNSPFSDLSNAAAEKPIKLVDEARDEDGAVFAEIAEYARSLVPTPKGIEVPRASLPQLLPYKIQRAWRAAELGDVEQAKRYCDAIEAACKPTRNAPSRLPRHVAATMEDLLERLTGTPSIDPSAGIGMRKGKSGASLGSWIEGRLTKFIAGEDEEGAPKPVPKEVKAAVAVGPFSHFSTISPSPSVSVSRAASSVDVNDGPAGFTSSDPSDGYAPDSTYAAWGKSEGDDTPHASIPTVSIDDDTEFINPMANLSFGPTPVPTDDYAPKKTVASRAVEEDDDDDLGFGNTSLSRGRTPKVEEDKSKSTAKETPKEEPKAAAKAEPEGQPKSGWFGGWFKKGESSGPIRAKLGEESSMVYDENLKRWVTKGAKSAPAAAAAPPPPPRGRTASPAHHEASVQPPRPATSTPPVPPMSMSRTNSSRPSGPPAPAGGPPSGPPGPPGPLSARPSASATPSIDDLLSRPPSSRPASSAAKKKRGTNRYVDVFQGGAQ